MQANKDVHQVSEYLPQITACLNKPQATAMTILAQQQFITDKCRAYTVDWLIELHQKFKLKTETLFVVLFLLDSFLSVNKHTTKSEVQNLGVTCLHIAGKYEEIHPPSLRQLLRVVNNSTLEKQDILKMEY